MGLPSRSGRLSFLWHPRQAPRDSPFHNSRLSDFPARISVFKDKSNRFLTKLHVFLCIYRRSSQGEEHAGTFSGPAIFLLHFSPLTDVSATIGPFLQDANVDPIVYQTYFNIPIFALSWLLLIYNRLIFTPWGSYNTPKFRFHINFWTTFYL